MKKKKTSINAIFNIMRKKRRAILNISCKRGYLIIFIQKSNIFIQAQHLYEANGTKSFIQTKYMVYGKNMLETDKFSQ